jgi:hypothetical protein
MAASFIMIVVILFQFGAAAASKRPCKSIQIRRLPVFTFSAAAGPAIAAGQRTTPPPSGGVGRAEGAYGRLTVHLPCSGRGSSLSSVSTLAHGLTVINIPPSVRPTRDPALVEDTGLPRLTIVKSKIYSRPRSSSERWCAGRPSAPPPKNANSRPSRFRWPRTSAQRSPRVCTGVHTLSTLTRGSERIRIEQIRTYSQTAARGQRRFRFEAPG